MQLLELLVFLSRKSGSRSQFPSCTAISQTIRQTGTICEQDTFPCQPGNFQQQSQIFNSSIQNVCSTPSSRAAYIPLFTPLMELSNSPPSASSVFWEIIYFRIFKETSQSYHLQRPSWMISMIRFLALSYSRPERHVFCEMIC
jgi:hypothetical protein